MPTGQWVPSGPQDLRHICIVLDMVPTRSAVHIGVEQLLGMIKQGKDFADYPHLEASAKGMLDQLSWWTKVPKAGRDVTVKGGSSR